MMTEISATPEWLSDNLPKNIVLEGLCGKGGMGSVFRVRHLDWKIQLAAKVPHSPSSLGVRALFQQEAELWASMGLHPYVATLYYIRDLGDRPVTFSEFAELGGMDSLLRRRGHLGLDDVTSLSRILTLSASTAWGLDAAHEKGLVHCDFKPGNSLVYPDFTAKVTDFGLSRMAQHGGFESPGSTPLYQSPEQARRERLDQATDIWSWAVTFFEMFIGEPVWHSGSVAGAAFEDFCSGGAKAPGFPKMPDDVMKLLGECFSPHPRERRESLSEIAEELNSIHSELCGDPSATAKPDTDLIAASSLNNRAVSCMDIGDTIRAEEYLRAALETDPYHPEALFNYHWLLRGENRNAASSTEKLLKESAAEDPNNPVPLALLAKLAHQNGEGAKAENYKQSAIALGASTNEIFESDPKSRKAAVLAPPIAGDEFAYHRDRFWRLIGKARAALRAGQDGDAHRYAMMAGDIPGFMRHPELRTLKADLDNPTRPLKG